MQWWSLYWRYQRGGSISINVYYWTYYALNPNVRNSVDLTYGEHQSDWEGIVVSGDKVRVRGGRKDTYSINTGGYWFWSHGRPGEKQDYGDVTHTPDGRPVVYVGLDTHASKRKRGEYDTLSILGATIATYGAATGDFRRKFSEVSQQFAFDGIRNWRGDWSDGDGIWSPGSQTIK